MGESVPAPLPPRWGRFPRYSDMSQPRERDRSQRRRPGNKASGASIRMPRKRYAVPARRRRFPLPLGVALLVVSVTLVLIGGNMIFSAFQPGPKRADLGGAIRHVVIF